MSFTFSQPQHVLKLFLIFWRFSASCSYKKGSNKKKSIIQTCSPLIQTCRSLMRSFNFVIQTCDSLFWIDALWFEHAILRSKHTILQFGDVIIWLKHAILQFNHAIHWFKHAILQFLKASVILHFCRFASRRFSLLSLCAFDMQLTGH